MTFDDINAELPAFHALNAQGGTLSKDWNATFRLFCKRWREHKDKQAPPRIEMSRPASDPVNSRLWAPTEKDWDGAVKLWASIDRWSAQFGPDPASRSCRCPKEILERHGIDPATGERRIPPRVSA
jgi:hypothetical protein